MTVLALSRSTIDSENAPAFSIAVRFWESRLVRFHLSGEGR